MNCLYEETFLAQLQVYSTLLGEHRLVELCQLFTLQCLRDQPHAHTNTNTNTNMPSPIIIETDSLYDDLPDLISANDAFIKPEPTPAPVAAPVVPIHVPVVEPAPLASSLIEPVDFDLDVGAGESQFKILRLKKSPLLHTSSVSTPEAKQNLVNTLKKSVVSKKKPELRDLNKLVKLGLLPGGSKVVPSAPEVSPDIFGTIVVGSSGKAGIQPSWNQDVLFIGKSNAPTQFLAAVNKQFPSYKLYGRENAWNDLLKMNSSGGYVSLADLWNQAR